MLGDRTGLIENDYESDNIVILDTETTGFGDEDELLQISIIDANGKTLFNEYCRPEHKTEWPEAEKVNGISPEKVKNCLTAADYRLELEAIFGRADLVVGYNTRFDVKFINKILGSTRQISGSLIEDVMQNFAPIYGEWNEERQSYRWKSLSVCAEYFGYDWGDDTAHDSLADCRATLFCWNKIRELKSKEETEEDLYDL